MNVEFAYRGRSALFDSGHGQTLGLAANLAREPVAFDAPMLRPLQFREAISALHDVVISDLRFKKREKSEYKRWKAEQDAGERVQRAQAFASALERSRQADALPPDFDRRFASARGRYWQARRAYGDYLRRHDMTLWRKLMPCDPIITVADDVCLFECFSGDESSYGCLSVDRQAVFGKPERMEPGVTNVDYSWDLFHQFQALRSYRDTRFRVDPQGFTVAATGEREYREEKIDLPAGWLAGFMQLQAAMTLSATHVRLGRGAVYSLLAWCKRHKARTSPRALRFELRPGAAPRLVLEPWELAIESPDFPYDGPGVAPIRVWGVRRLLALARLLPIADSFDVYLPGSGLPSFWVARLGPMRLTLGLSGWTANDWTRGSAIDLLAPPVEVSPELIAAAADCLQRRRAATLDEVRAAVSADTPTPVDRAAAAAALRILARRGQLIYDLPAGVYRWRQVMSHALGEADVGPEHEEMIGLRQILARGGVRIEKETRVDGLGLLLAGATQSIAVELLIDADGRIKRGKCACSYFHRFGLRNGPCRHMMALRFTSGQGRNMGRTAY